MSKFINAIDTLVNAMINIDAENYNQHLVTGDDGVDYVVTVQRKDGLTPCEKLAEAEVRIAKLTKDVANIADVFKSSFKCNVASDGHLIISVDGYNAIVGAINKALSETAPSN